MLEESQIIEGVSESIMFKAFNFAKKNKDNRQEPIVVSVNISAL